MNRISGIVERCRGSVVRTLSPLSAAALNFVYPPLCQLCGNELGVDCRLTLCETCLSKLQPRLTEECPQCGAPVGPFANLEKGCGQCRREKYAFDRVIRLGVYDGDMRRACLRAKAKGGSSLSRALAVALVDVKRSQFEESTIDLIAPVPEHWIRRLLHPHYAAETFSRELSRGLNIRWARGLLKKLRRTPKQATSPTALRRQQQNGAFGVNRSAELAGKNVLLVDDILTTGSTAHAAARALKQAGAKRVIVAVIAVSPLRK